MPVFETLCILDFALKIKILNNVKITAMVYGIRISDVAFNSPRMITVVLQQKLNVDCAAENRKIFCP